MLTCSLRQAQRDNQWLFIHKYADLRQFGDKYITDRQTYVPSRTLTLTKVAIQSPFEEVILLFLVEPFFRYFLLIFFFFSFLILFGSQSKVFWISSWSRALRRQFLHSAKGFIQLKLQRRFSTATLFSNTSSPLWPTAEVGQLNKIYHAESLLGGIF